MCLYSIFDIYINACLCSLSLSYSGMFRISERGQKIWGTEVQSPSGVLGQSPGAPVEVWGVSQKLKIIC